MRCSCNRLVYTAAVFITACVPFLTSCDQKPSAALKGQVNATIRFYGLAVDQDGKPLPGARIEFQVDAYPKDWTFETRGRPYDVSFASGTSDASGRFDFEVAGCILRLKSAEASGYRHLFETYQSDKHPSVLGYHLIAWSEQQYQSDPNNPAVFVFVKAGAEKVSALPSVGGSRWNGKGWSPYRPAWPKSPSLKDVVYSGDPATTRPSSQPAAEGGGG
jgi:hypothetical protein